MRQKTKDIIQYSTAIAMIASAIGLAVLSFLMIAEVHHTVLVYVSEAIAYAAGIFGVSLYFNSKVQDINRRLKDFNRSDEEEVEQDNKDDREQDLKL